eukprot:403358144
MKQLIQRRQSSFFQNLDLTPQQKCPPTNPFKISYLILPSWTGQYQTLNIEQHNLNRNIKCQQ